MQTGLTVGRIPHAFRDAQHSAGLRLAQRYDGDGGTVTAVPHYTPPIYPHTPDLPQDSGHCDQTNVVPFLMTRFGPTAGGSTTTLVERAVVPAVVLLAVTTAPTTFAYCPPHLPTCPGLRTALSRPRSWRRTLITRGWNGSYRLVPVVAEPVWN